MTERRHHLLLGVAPHFCSTRLTVGTILMNWFEGVACYERHPWDVRGKVGSERKFASSDKFAKVQWYRDPGFYLRNSARGDPKYWYCPKGIWAKKIPIGT